LCFWEGCSDEDDNGYIYPFAVYPGGLPGPLDDYYNEMNAHEVIQENHYYPFGMGMEGSWSNETAPEQRYLYNGKERDTELGLNWDHFGFRMYDSSIGRFTGVDPISDQFAHVSTYNYAENSPIANIDLWGLQAMSANAARDPKTQKWIRDNPKKAFLGGLAFAAAPAAIALAPEAALASMGMSLVYETGGSVVTGNGLNEVDLADVAIAGATGSFWTGLILGSVVDIKMDGTSQSAFGIVGDKKALTSIGIDLTIGAVGKAAEQGISATAKALDEAADGFTDLAKKLTDDNYLPDATLNTRYSRKAAANMAGEAGHGTVLRNVGNAAKASATTIRDMLTPWAQKEATDNDN
jgi:RHS repeat-associated protein